MTKHTLRPTSDNTFIITSSDTKGKDAFDFIDQLALSRQQEDAKDFESACNIRFKAFQTLVDIIPEEGDVTLEWEDDNTQAAIVTGYYSGIDHFLSGDWEMAAAIFEMILDLDPEDHMEATVPLAYTYLAMREFDSFDEIINDVNDKYIDKVMLTLWSEFLKNSVIEAGELARLKKSFSTFYAEIIADAHLADEKYLTDINSQKPSKESLAREYWFKTEHLWLLFPDFVTAIKRG